MQNLMQSSVNMLAAGQPQFAPAPLVSVVLPVYNALPYLPLAIESILSQTYSDFELIALDDASTDGSREYLESLTDPRVQLVVCKKQGLGPLLNLGISLARGEFVARMDADDISLPSRFEKQVHLLRSRPEVLACGCQAVSMHPDGSHRGNMVFPTGDTQIRRHLLVGSPMPHPGVMFRRDAVRRAGGYATALVPAEDYDLWWRLAEGGELANCHEVLLKYRVHAASVSQSRAGEQQRTANRVATAHLCRTGVASSSEEAARFLDMNRTFFECATSPDLDVASERCLLSVIRRFCVRWESPHCRRGELATVVRRELRWACMRNASDRGLRSRRGLRWLWLAVRLEPRKLGAAMIVVRLVKRAIQTASAGFARSI